MSSSKSEGIDFEAIVKSAVQVSRDQSLDKKWSNVLFSRSVKDIISNESPDAQALWRDLRAVVRVMRLGRGLYIHELAKLTSLSPRRVRQCIRLIITFGGVVEVICDDWEPANEGRFLLHN